MVYNSQVSRRLHTALGYGDSRAEVLPNGVDLETFRPLAGARQDLRQELKIPPEAWWWAG